MYMTIKFMMFDVDDCPPLFFHVIRGQSAIFQTCFVGTSVIVSVTVMKTSVEFYSAHAGHNAYVILPYRILRYMDSKLQQS